MKEVSAITKGQSRRDQEILTFGAFLKDKLLLFLLHISCMLVLAGFLLLTGYAWDSCALILICWFLVLTAWVLLEYHERRSYFSRIGQVLDEVDQRFLLGELMPESPRMEDRLYRGMIRKSNKSVIERIRRVEDEQQEYREYIESWVHEIKAPITSIALMCENRRDEWDDPQYPDRKWILFILNQLILNSTKYKAEEHACIRITAEAFPHGIRLLIEDNGAGIKQEELPRIFEKGFTGTNGRKNDRATGMGLYLCRKLCRKLGIEIDAQSEYGTGTRIALEFPVSSYVIKEPQKEP